MSSTEVDQPAQPDVERPCIDCGEPTLNPQRCRDCDIEWLFSTWPKCEECGRTLVSDLLAREVADGETTPHNHARGCSKAKRCDVHDCGAEAMRYAGTKQGLTATAGPWLCAAHAQTLMAR